MANKNKGKRQGGKYNGSHTTVVPAAEVVCDIAHDLAVVTKIAIGIIESGCKAVPQKRVKVVEKQGALLLKVRDNTAVQELYVYATDLASAKDGITKGAEKAGMKVVLAE